jgi:S-DNA-T family DNA segregation ATPase FtsK/SpoIIIE
MTKKKNKKKTKREKEVLNNIEFEEIEKRLNPETKKSVLGVVFITLSIITLFAYFDLAGVAGEYLKSGLTTLLGIGYFIVPITFLMVAVALFKSIKTNFYLSVIFGGILFFLSFLGLIDILSHSVSSFSGNMAAGWVGFIIAYPFYNFLGFVVSVIIFISAILISFAVIFNIPIRFPKGKIKEDEEYEEEEYEGENEEYEDEYEEDGEEENTGFISKAISSSKKSVEKLTNKVSAVTSSKKEKQDSNDTPITNINPSKAVSDFIIETHQRSYSLPPIDLLDKEKGSPSSGDVKAYSDTIKKTLKHFGIEVEMGEINVGPTVTQYTLKPAQGVKLAKIIALQNDLSLALAAHPIRIEAPIPGRSLVGIEIPNKVIAVVKLRDMIDKPTFIESAPLSIVLGRDVSGISQYADIEKMPHLLIAGATGSGKSVTVHTIIASLLYKNFPQMLKFLMVDPKRVELSVYNGIPHLLAPVIVEREKAIAALNWAVKEMERRYKFLADHDVRNIGSYNSQIAGTKGDEKIMPYIVIVVDELADLMSSSPREVEAAIVRLAQMSRAVGIHLIISTQRPSVEVITGLIKANIPCRIALQVTSIVDSRTILDMAGAEKLLGNGDMLYLPQDQSKPKRIQCSFISEKEVKNIVNYLKKEAEQYENDEGETHVDSGDLKDTLERKKQNIDLDIDLDSFVASSNKKKDDLFDEAKSEVVRAEKASTSFLQRRLGIGYARAARLIDMLEEEAVIGPQNGSKAREVYVTKEEEDYDDE